MCKRKRVQVNGTSLSSRKSNTNTDKQTHTLSCKKVDVELSLSLFLRWQGYTVWDVAEIMECMEQLTEFARLLHRHHGSGTRLCREMSNTNGERGSLLTFWIFSDLVPPTGSPAPLAGFGGERRASTVMAKERGRARGGAADAGPR